MSGRKFYLYLCQFSDGWIKAGVSTSVCLRVVGLRNSIGKKHGAITCFATSGPLSVVARKMESRLLRRLCARASSQHKRELFGGIDWSEAYEEFAKLPVDDVDLKDNNRRAVLPYKRKFPDFESRNFELIARSK